MLTNGFIYSWIVIFKEYAPQGRTPQGRTVTYVTVISGKIQ